MNAESVHRLAEGIHRSPLGFFVRNWSMAIITLLGCVFGGIYAISVMPVESEPEVKIPIGTVTTIFPGAAPADVEKLVTDELEEEIEQLDDLNEVTSTSREGVSVIVVEFEADADLDEAINDLREAVDVAQPDLPDDVENDPFVEQIRAGDEPIVTFLLTGRATMKEFDHYADELQDRLEAVPGVNEVDVNGLPEPEMQVLIDLPTLEGLQLSILDVVNAISRNHVDLPIGSIETDNLYYQASLRGQFSTPAELEQLAITERGNQTILLRDIATVREVFGPTSTETRYYDATTGEFNAAVSLAVRKQVGKDLVKMVDEAKVIVADFEANTLPEDLRIITTEDFSEYIWEDIRRLSASALQTTIVIFVVLFLALGKWEASAVASALPILYLISFVGLALVGATFNFLTFFALILSLGIVVDTSTVIIEGIYENMQKHGLDPESAALGSVGAFWSPLTSGSLTTIAAFLPLGLMTGIMGEYVKHIPITVNITLVASLFTALMILPPLAARLLKGSAASDERKPPFLHRWFEPLGVWYSSFIEKILASSKLRKRWTLAMVGLFIFSFVLLQTGLLKFNLFTSSDADFFAVVVEAPEGTTLEETKRLTQPVEEYMTAYDDIERFVTVYGSNGSHTARITTTLVDKRERDAKSYELAVQMREDFKQFTAVDVTIEEQESGPPSGADIDVRLLGEDIKATQEFAVVVQDILKNTEGTTDVRNDLELSPGEFSIALKRDRLAYFGVTASDVGRTLRSAVFGDDSVKIKEGGEEIPIVVQIDFREEACVSDPVTALTEAKEHVTVCRSHPPDASTLMNLLVPTPRGPVAMSELATVTVGPAITTIRHFETKRVVSVKGNVADGYVLADVLRNFNASLAETEIPAGITVDLGGENEDTAESMASLARATILAALLIVAILVYQFGSFKQVLIILFTIPLAIMGVFYGLTVIRIPLSFPGMIGLTALLGVVVNDAIVLVDKINSNRAHGLDVIEAAITGCRQRLEPVIITTLTTALGVTPLIWSGEIFRDLAIVVAVGICVATVFTLVMVPIFYVALESPRSGPGLLRRLSGKLGRVFGGGAT